MDPSMLPGDEPGGTQERLNELERMLLAGERLMMSGNKATAAQIRTGMVRTIFPHLQKLEEIEHSWNPRSAKGNLRHASVPCLNRPTPSTRSTMPISDGPKAGCQWPKRPIASRGPILSKRRSDL